MFADESRMFFWKIIKLIGFNLSESNDYMPRTPSMNPSTSELLLQNLQYFVSLRVFKVLSSAWNDIAFSSIIRI